MHDDQMLSHQLVFIDHKQNIARDEVANVKWWMETSLKGHRHLVVNGYKFYRYGSGIRKFYHWYCRSYQSLG